MFSGQNVFGVEIGNGVEIGVELWNVEGREDARRGGGREIPHIQLLGIYMRHSRLTNILDEFVPGIPPPPPLIDFSAVTAVTTTTTTITATSTPATLSIDIIETAKQNFHLAGTDSAGSKILCGRVEIPAHSWC